MTSQLRVLYPSTLKVRRPLTTPAPTFCCSTVVINKAVSNIMFSLKITMNICLSLRYSVVYICTYLMSCMYIHIQTVFLYQQAYIHVYPSHRSLVGQHCDKLVAEGGLEGLESPNFESRGQSTSKSNVINS